ncbi:hypothetical protein BZA70DRAFT_265154 [Myxozyma melibiosi]|uniref:Uncharacterized protein n=1 Tax=Myxozyma melibiosi TaxID=54550 RepID=A0ABR1FDA5_9ASCO
MTSWLEDYCFVCDKVCPSGSIYCSESCKHFDFERAKSQSPPISPPLLPVQSSVNESGRRSSAIQVQLELSPPSNYLVPFYESTSDRYYGRQQSRSSTRSSSSDGERGRRASAQHDLFRGRQPLFS